MNSGAKFNDDRTHRYALWRIWNEDKPIVMFIGLNPSTANEYVPDHTIGRVMKFADKHGFGGFYMMNLFSFVTPYPEQLKADIQPPNDQWLRDVAERCQRICYAWGAFGQQKRFTVIRDRANEIKSRFPGGWCLGKTKGGHPCHPLFLPKDRKLILFIEDTDVPKKKAKA